jgi:hypothetical protein
LHGPQTPTFGTRIAQITYEGSENNVYIITISGTISFETIRTARNLLMFWGIYVGLDEIGKVELNMFLPFLSFGDRDLEAKSAGMLVFRCFISWSLWFTHICPFCERFHGLAENVSSYDKWIGKPASKCIYEVNHSCVPVWSQYKSTTAPQMDSINSDWQ